MSSRKKSDKNKLHRNSSSVLYGLNYHGAKLQGIRSAALGHMESCNESVPASAYLRAVICHRLPVIMAVV